MAAAVILIVITVSIVTFVRWTTRRTDEIQDFYSDNEDSQMVKTLLHLNQSRGNHR